MMRNRLLILIFSIVILFSFLKIGESIYESYQNKQMYTSLQNTFIMAPTPEIIKETTDSNDRDVKRIGEKFLPLVEINDETVGWVTLSNSSIDYPIVQTSDNEFYLDYSFERNKSKSGSIFMDYRNNQDLFNRHTILYGHHMRNQSMFSDLLKYQDENHFIENRYITLQTLYEDTKWEIFSAYVTGTDFYYIITDFGTDDEYVKFLQKIQSKSTYESEMTITEEDRILTLSTCAYDFDDARFVVHARRIQ
ncbi:class B sortase [Bacillaceae bacterium IKA-2]|nr:class B sortase [Bacillaceae bacterium IKA-2]